MNTYARPMTIVSEAIAQIAVLALLHWSAVTTTSFVLSRVA
jgi:hypothetical protein